MKLKKIVSRFTFQFDCKSDNYNNNNWQKNFTNVLFILYHYYCFIKGHCDVRICIYAKTLKCLTTQFLRVWFTDRIVPVENCTRHSFIWQSLFIDLWQVVGFHQSYSPTIIVKPRYYLKWKGSLVMVNNSTNNKTMITSHLKKLNTKDTMTYMYMLITIIFLPYIQHINIMCPNKKVTVSTLDNVNCRSVLKPKKILHYMLSTEIIIFQNNTCLFK